MRKEHQLLEGHICYPETEEQARWVLSGVPDSIITNWSLEVKRGLKEWPFNGDNDEKGVQFEEGEVIAFKNSLPDNPIEISCEEFYLRAKGEWPSMPESTPKETILTMQEIADLAGVPVETLKIIK